MIENPYQSPRGHDKTARPESARPRFGPREMALWGFAIGSMGGATFGAVGGGIWGLVGVGLASLLGESTRLHETTLVVLLTAPTVAGAAVGAVSGALLGPPLGFFAGLSSAAPSRWPVTTCAAILFASVGLGAGSLGGADQATPALWIGAVIGLATGAVGGVRLGQRLWMLARSQAAPP